MAVKRLTNHIMYAWEWKVSFSRCEFSSDSIYRVTSMRDENNFIRTWIYVFRIAWLNSFEIAPTITQSSHCMTPRFSAGVFDGICEKTILTKIALTFFYPPPPSGKACLFGNMLIVVAFKYIFFHKHSGLRGTRVSFARLNGASLASFFLFSHS